MSKLFETLQALEGRERQLGPAEAVKALEGEQGGRTGRSSVTGLVFLALVVLSVVVGLYVADYMVDSSSVERRAKRYEGVQSPVPAGDGTTAISPNRGQGVSAEIYAVSDRGEGQGISAVKQADKDGEEAGPKSAGNEVVSEEVSRLEQLMEQVPAARSEKKASSSAKSAQEDRSRARSGAVSLMDDASRRQAGANRDLLRQKEAAKMARYRMKLLQAAEECRQRGDIEEAASILKRLWRDWKEPAISNNLAACLILLNDYEGAEKVLKEGLRLSPSDPDLLYNHRLLLSLKGETASES